MIDLIALARIADAGEAGDSVVIERNWLRRALVEIAAGRTALATLALGDRDYTVPPAAIGRST